jgi:thiol-disulfide isomerase/thioredoxin
MKKFFIAMSLVLGTVNLAFSQGHKIEFNIEGVSEGDCILAHYYADQNRIVDTSEVSSNGKVIFQGAESLLNGIYILVLPNRTYVEVVVPSDDQEFKISFDTTLSVMKKKVQGSLENSIFLEFDQFAHLKSMEMRDLKKSMENVSSELEKQEFEKKKKAIDQSVKDKRQEIISKYPESFVSKVFKAGLEVEIPENLQKDTTGKRFLYYRDHYWDNIDLTEDGLIRTPIFHRKLEYYFTKMFLQMPDSIIPAIDDLAGRMENKADELFKYTVWWTTKHYEDVKIMCMDKMLHHMAKNYYCAGRCFWADSALKAKMCEHAGKIGPTLCDEIAPDLNLVDTSLYVQYSLHKIEYPVTIMVFWDPECGHCKKELPKLKEMYDTMNAKGVQVFAIYTQGDVDGWKRYIRDHQLNWINVVDAYNNSGYRKKYNIISTPQVLILDEDKRIRFKNAPAENIGEICDMLLKEYEEKRNPKTGQN